MRLDGALLMGTEPTDGAVPIFALSESVPQKGGRLNRTTPVDIDRLGCDFHMGGRPFLVSTLGTAFTSRLG